MGIAAATIVKSTATYSWVRMLRSPALGASLRKIGEQFAHRPQPLLNDRSVDGPRIHCAINSRSMPRSQSVSMRSVTAAICARANAPGRLS